MMVVTPHIKVDPAVGVDALPKNDLASLKHLKHPVSKTLATNDEAFEEPVIDHFDNEAPPTTVD